MDIMPPDIGHHDELPGQQDSEKDFQKLHLHFYDWKPDSNNKEYMRYPGVSARL